MRRPRQTIAPTLLAREAGTGRITGPEKWRASAAFATHLALIDGYVTDGPYAHLRHPLYAASIVVFSGIGMAHRTLSRTGLRIASVAPRQPKDERCR